MQGAETLPQFKCQGGAFSVRQVVLIHDLPIRRQILQKCFPGPIPANPVSIREQVTLRHPARTHPSMQYW
jgi:hypothetical protein